MPLLMVDAKGAGFPERSLTGNISDLKGESVLARLPLRQ